jgi:hypothetical protein
MKTTALILGTCAFLALPIGQAGADQCTSEIDGLVRTLTDDDAGPAPTPAPNSVMERETTGSAVSPPDMQRPTQDRPAAAQSVQAQIAASHDLAAAMSALQRARTLDRHGDQAECRKAVGEAKLMSGAR